MSEQKQMSAIDLLSVNVSGHTEKKNGLTYLSWAWAWDQVLRADKDANFNVELFGDTPLMRIGDSYMVWVSVIVFGKKITCMLPVLDHRNKPIANPDSFHVNTSIMRCLTKAIAMHGLGLYIYAGEDLPMVSPEEAEKAAQENRAHAMIFTAKISAEASEQIDVDGLNALFKKHGASLQQLKADHPDLHAQLVTVYTACKADLTKE
jgi:hypothetical protein